MALVPQQSNTIAGVLHTAVVLAAIASVTVLASNHQVDPSAAVAVVASVAGASGLGAGLSLSGKTGV